jgi:hypothetical protein
MTHLKSYCNKMTEVVHDEKLLIHFFNDSFSGVTLSWYMKLNNTKIQKMERSGGYFVKQYKYNIDITLDETNLSNMKKKT